MISGGPSADLVVVRAAATRARVTAALTPNTAVMISGGPSADLVVVRAAATRARETAALRVSDVGGGRGS